MIFRLLVVDGNVRSAREGHAAHYLGKTPGQAYADVLESLAPDMRCDVCLPADEGANMPDSDGIQGYDGGYFWERNSLSVKRLQQPRATSGDARGLFDE